MRAAPTTARLLQGIAAALHCLAGFFNERAYLVEYGRQQEVDPLDAVPLRVKFAERRQFIRDQKLDAGQRFACSPSVKFGEIERKLDECLVHQGDGPADGDCRDVHDAYLAWVKSVENRPGWEFLRHRKSAGSVA